VTAGLFKTHLTIKTAAIKPTNAGKYKCLFTISSTETYQSEGSLDVRLVTTNPSDANVYTYTNAGFKLSCTLDASDSKSGITWTGPDGVIASSKYSNDGSNANIHILSLEATSKSGEYRCKFAFATGTDTVPEGVFADVNFNQIQISPVAPRSTHGTGVIVTLTCQVTSPSELTLKFHDGSKELTPKTDKYEGGKTIAEYEITVDAANKGGTFTCRKSATEFSTSSILTVLSMTTALAEETKGDYGTSTTLVCVAQFHEDVITPTFSWFKGSSAATEKPEAAVVADDKSSVTSKLPITINSDSLSKVYKCVATYTGLAAGTTLESSTTVLINSSKYYNYPWLK
jgi:hypothetical protein